MAEKQAMRLVFGYHLPFSIAHFSPTVLCISLEMNIPKPSLKLVFGYVVLK